MSMFNTIVPPNSNQYQWSHVPVRLRGVRVNYSADHANITNANSNHSGRAATS